MTLGMNVYCLTPSILLHTPSNCTNEFNFFSTEKEQQEAIEHIDEVQNEIDR